MLREVCAPEVVGMQAQDPERVTKEVARRLAELRERSGVTQEELARIAGVSVKYVQRLENRGANLTIWSLVKFANIFRVEVGEFFARPSSSGPRSPGRPRR